MWCTAMVGDYTRLTYAADGVTVVRDPLPLAAYVPVSVLVTSASILLAQRLGVLRWALLSLPLMAAWWSSAIAG